MPWDLNCRPQGGGGPGSNDTLRVPIYNWYLVANDIESTSDEVWSE
jgi:hypothetical protein